MLPRAGGRKPRARLSEPDDASIVPRESTRGGRRREGGGRQCRCVVLRTNDSVLQCRSCTWVNSWLPRPYVVCSPRAVSVSRTRALLLTRKPAGPQATHAKAGDVTSLLRRSLAQGQRATVSRLDRVARERCLVQCYHDGSPPWSLSYSMLLPRARSVLKFPPSSPMAAHAMSFFCVACFVSSEDRSRTASPYLAFAR